MKKSIFFLFISLSFVCHAQRQTYYYRAGGVVQNITMNNNRMLVYFDKSQIEIADIYEQYNVIREIDLSKDKAERLVAFEIEYNTSSSSFLKELDYIWDIEPVIGLNAPVPVSNIFYVELKDTGDYHLLVEMAEQYRVSISGKLAFTNWYTLETDKHSGGNALEMSNAFFESSMFANCDPGFIYTVFINSNCRSDTDFNQQWGMDAINACDAWTITTGDTNIYVAVIDGGTDTSHDEFNSLNVKVTYDANTYQSPNTVFHPHATGISGIIFADHDREKVAGLAPNASLIDIRHSASGTNPESFLQTIVTAYSYLNSNYNNTSIINNSWGISPTQYDETAYSSLIVAIQVLYNGLKNNKGAVIVFSSGNNTETNPGTEIMFPGRCYSDAIIVGSIDNTLQRASSSRYGAELDVVAPGAGIYSTTTTTTDNKKIYDTMFGTSFAAPHVSGVAALMLSANSSLTTGQVARIIKGTAQKVGNYNYQYSADHLNGTWNIEMGHGLVDAAAAVSAAAATPNFDLYIRDNSTDDGAEPNTTTGSVTSSPDIVVTDLNDNVVTGLNSGVSYKIKVTVHNTGAATALFVPTMVKVHWTCESNNLQWENSWTNAGTLCGVSKSGTVTLPANGFYLMQNISPNGSVTVTIPWTTPNYLGFQCVSYYGSNLTMSLVAEVVDGGLTIGKTASDYPLEHYVRTNNNVARKNYSMLITFTYGRIILSPNPTTGRAVVSCELSDEISEATVTISDMTGHCVSTFNVTHSSAERSVDMDNFPTGQYLVQLIYQGNVLDAKQLVVE